jgi:sugar/nucleoside kinase (ribokinase family)
MIKHDIYLYGMTLLTSSHLLAGDFPPLDTYAEIKESYQLPGGETGTCAVVLASLGCSVKIDGNWQGTSTYDKLMGYMRRFGVDASRLKLDEGFEGLQDLVIIDRHSRTVFGKFQAYYNNPLKRWSAPAKEDIENAAAVGLDPYFGEQALEAARVCRELGKKYVTIDCRHDSQMHRYSAVNAVSHEYLDDNYPGEDMADVFRKYADATDGLVIFTYGVKNLLYGRRGQPPQSFAPYKVDAVSTLGAGDTFKAGAVYGLFKGFEDREIVRFASAAAAVACSSFPIALNPPTLEKINKLTESRS